MDVNNWHRCTFGDTPLDQFHGLVGAVRGIIAHGRLRIGYLNEIPYLFARLKEPGV